MYWWERDRNRDWHCSTYWYLHELILYVPWPGIEPETLAYQDDAPTNWATAQSFYILIQINTIAQLTSWDCCLPYSWELLLPPLSVETPFPCIPCSPHSGISLSTTWLLSKKKSAHTGRIWDLISLKVASVSLYTGLTVCCGRDSGLQVLFFPKYGSTHWGLSF